MKHDAAYYERLALGEIGNAHFVRHPDLAQENARKSIHVDEAQVYATLAHAAAVESAAMTQSISTFPGVRPHRSAEGAGGTIMDVATRLGEEIDPEAHDYDHRD